MTWSVKKIVVPVFRTLLRSASHWRSQLRSCANRIIAPFPSTTFFWWGSGHQNTTVLFALTESYKLCCTAPAVKPIVSLFAFILILSFTIEVVTNFLGSAFIFVSNYGIETKHLFFFLGERVMPRASGCRSWEGRSCWQPREKINNRSLRLFCCFF